MYLHRSFAQVTCMRLRSHPFFFLFNQRSLFCSSSANCFFSLGMSPFDLLFKKKKEEERHPFLGRRQGEQGWLEDGARLLKEVISSCDGIGCYPIQMFSAKEIEQAIGQFYHGEGSYNDYEGTHEDRQIIIKVYRMGNQRDLAFNEIATVTQINHANVAKLLGCCFEMEQPILIYEKVPFILRDRLHQANPSSSLISWEHRLRIAIEIAYAITYLHTAKYRPIVHTTIACSNILLDEHYKPKLCDFSFSKTIPLGETHVKTCFMAGTFGYLAPEYAIRGIVSEKSDVYSYGVVLVELLSGKRPYFTIDMDEDGRLHKFLNKDSTEKEERLELILENGLSMDVRQVEQAMACMEVAVGCISGNPDERPAMKEVAQQLEQIERDGCYVDYEGTHEDHQIIIKVYREEREMAFNEIATVTQIKHANVAKLLCCCFEMEQPILIYEKVPFILRDRLHNANPSSSLISWEHRLRIAIEIAYAITYLHTAKYRPIVHTTIACSNILLDEHYKPKLADFSFSLTIPVGETHVQTDYIVGTFGYMDDDYARTGYVCEKTDVYSYGVVLLELLSGKKQRELENISPQHHPFWDFIQKEITDKEKRLKLILGNGLSMNVHQVEQATACMELAGTCMINNRDEIPAMKDVTKQLGNEGRDKTTMADRKS